MRLRVGGSWLRTLTGKLVEIGAAHLPVGLHLALRLEHSSVRSGAGFFPTVVVSERGPRSFTMGTGNPSWRCQCVPGHGR
jgi:hypothetical protein